MFILTDASVYDILMENNLFSLGSTYTSKTALLESKNPRFVSEFLRFLLTLLIICLLMLTLALDFNLGTVVCFY